MEDLDPILEIKKVAQNFIKKLETSGFVFSAKERDMTPEIENQRLLINQAKKSRDYLRASRDCASLFLATWGINELLNLKDILSEVGLDDEANCINAVIFVMNLHYNPGKNISDEYIKPWVQLTRNYPGLIWKAIPRKHEILGCAKYSGGQLNFIAFALTSLGTMVEEKIINKDLNGKKFTESERSNVAARLYRDSGYPQGIYNLACMILNRKVSINPYDNSPIGEKNRYLVAANILHGIGSSTATKIVFLDAKIAIAILLEQGKIDRKKWDPVSRLGDSDFYEFIATLYREAATDDALLNLAGMIKLGKTHKDAKGNPFTKEDRNQAAAKLYRSLGTAVAKYNFAVMIQQRRINEDLNWETIQAKDRHDVIANLFRESGVPEALCSLANMIIQGEADKDLHNRPFIESDRFKLAADLYLESRTPEAISNFATMVQNKEIDCDLDRKPFEDSKRYSVAAAIYEESGTDYALYNLACLMIKNYEKTEKNRIKLLEIAKRISDKGCSAAVNGHILFKYMKKKSPNENLLSCKSVLECFDTALMYGFREVLPLRIELESKISELYVLQEIKRQESLDIASKAKANQSIKNACPGDGLEALTTAEPFSVDKDDNTESDEAEEDDLDFIAAANELSTELTTQKLARLTLKHEIKSVTEPSSSPLQKTEQWKRQVNQLRKEKALQNWQEKKDQQLKPIRHFEPLGKKEVSLINCSDVSQKKEVTIAENWEASAIDGRARLAEIWDKRITDLIEDIKIGGSLGKPEVLTETHKGWMSRRISQKHRLVYKLEMSEGQRIICVSECGKHYLKIPKHGS